MNDQIFSKIKTKESLDLFKEEIELLLKSLYKSERQNFNSVLSNKVRAFVVEFIRNKTASGDFNLEGYLRELIDRAQELPTITLFLAFEPSENTLDHFYSFISSACRQPVLLEVNYDPTIIGGVVIIYKGEYRDFSFRKIFEKEFQEDQESMLKLLEK